MSVNVIRSKQVKVAIYQFKHNKFSIVCSVVQVIAGIEEIFVRSY